MKEKRKKMDEVKSSAPILPKPHPSNIQQPSSNIINPARHQNASPCKHSTRLPPFPPLHLTSPHFLTRTQPQDHHSNSKNQKCQHHGRSNPPHNSPLPGPTLPPHRAHPRKSPPTTRRRSNRRRRRPDSRAPDKGIIFLSTALAKSTRACR